MIVHAEIDRTGAPLQVTHLGWFGFAVLSKYKWRLDQEYSYQSSINGIEYDSKYLKITKDGVVTHKKGYCWDGASGPTWDTESCRLAAMKHDGWYQILREADIPNHLRAAIKLYADQVQLHDQALADGMSEFRAGYWLYFVDKFGGSNCAPSDNDGDHGDGGFRFPDDTDGYNR